MMNHYSLSHPVPCRYKAVWAAKKGESIWISKIFGSQRRKRMEREKRKNRWRRKNVTLGGHTEGNVKIVLEFWTQNSQYHIKKINAKSALFILFFLQFCFCFCFHSFYVLYSYMYTLYCYCLLRLFCFVFSIKISLTFLSLTFHGSQAFDPSMSKIAKKKSKGNMRRI